MPELIVAPHMEISRVLVPGVVTVPLEMATIGCSPGCTQDDLCPHPSRLQDIPLTMHGLELHLHDAGKDMIAKLAPRGYEWLGELRFHGPFWSREVNRRMTDFARSEWQLRAPWANKDHEHHPEAVLPVVGDVDAWNPYMDYVLIGAFLKRNARMELD